MSKKHIRQEIQAKRLAFSGEPRINAEQAIGKHLEASGITRRYSNIAGYIPQRGEVNIMPIMRSIATLGCQLSLPVIEAEKTMLFHHWKPGDALLPSKYGIPAPLAGKAVIPELILLPLFACDRQGVRLGAGGGYYDRTLSQPAYQNCYRIGVGFSFQLLPHLPSEPHDVRLHAFLSEEGLIKFERVE